MEVDFVGCVRAPHTNFRGGFAEFSFEIREWDPRLVLGGEVRLGKIAVLLSITKFGLPEND